MSKISKNIFIAILSITTAYLGWAAFAHAATFTTQKNQWAAVTISYTNCQTYTANSNAKMNVVKGTDTVGQFVLKEGTLSCPNNTLAQSIKIEKTSAPDDGGDENIKAVQISLVCCAAQIYGLHN